MGELWHADSYVRVKPISFADQRRDPAGNRHGNPRCEGLWGVRPRHAGAPLWPVTGFGLPSAAGYH